MDLYYEILLLIIDNSPSTTDHRPTTPERCLQGSDESGPMPASRTSPLPPTMRRTYSVILPCSCGNLRVLERSKRPLCCHFPFFGSLWMGLTEKRRTQSRAGSRNHDETPTAYHARMLSCYPCHFSCSFCRHVECSREAPSCFLHLFFWSVPLSLLLSSIKIHGKLLHRELHTINCLIPIFSFCVDRYLFLYSYDDGK